MEIESQSKYTVSNTKQKRKWQAVGDKTVEQLGIVKADQVKCGTREEIIPRTSSKLWMIVRKGKPEIVRIT